MELTNYTLETLGFLFAIGLLAGFLDTLAGGGGLLTIPALMMSGVPPIYALGTNKLQGTMGTATATLILFRKQKLDWQKIKALMLASFVGAVIGSIVVQFINASILSFVVPVVLGFIALYFVISPKISNNSKLRDSKCSYQNVVVPLIGCYDGMFGPGTGSFFVLTGTLFKRLELIQSTFLAKPLNFASNVASLVVFLGFGHVVWLIGLLMMAGQVIGASIGAHYLVKANPKVIRLLIVFMSVAMLLRYSYSMGWFN
ncbi:MAG: TSUP family transporter [Gammaproteobacteria bacterium]|nr:TSUP family transporter [Gammaproteobacteria bacterium]